MATRLEALIASKPTLMIGLSGQEANIQGLFAQTRNDIPWQWQGGRAYSAYAPLNCSFVARILRHQP
jgi:hypothetical protein